MTDRIKVVVVYKGANALELWRVAKQVARVARVDQSEVNMKACGDHIEVWAFPEERDGEG